MKVKNGQNAVINNVQFHNNITEAEEQQTQELADSILCKENLFIEQLGFKIKTGPFECNAH
jgi:hypothetical protein